MTLLGLRVKMAHRGDTDFTVAGILSSKLAALAFNVEKNCAGPKVSRHALFLGLADHAVWLPHGVLVQMKKLSLFKARRGHAHAHTTTLDHDVICIFNSCF